MKYTAHEYQKRAQAFITKNDKNQGKALFLDMGLGKTVIMLSAFVEMQDRGDATNCLIVSTKRIAESVWRDEIQKWDHTKHLTLSVIAGNPKQREAAALAFAALALTLASSIS